MDEVKFLPADVKRQPDTAPKLQLTARLKEIKKEALARLP